MITVTTDFFFDNLDVPQLMQWYRKMNAELEAEIKPHFVDDVRHLEYVHFIVIEGIKNIYMSADASYTDYGGPYISRHIRNVRVYENEVDMDFYMALLEYNNTIDPNPVLFNGRGTRPDAKMPFLDMIVFCRDIVFDKNLN